MANATITGAFIESAVFAINYGSLPPDAIEISKTLILDGLACAFAGAAEPSGIGRILTDYTRQMGGAPQASVFAAGFKTSMANAAFANGTMMHALVFDNTIYPTTSPVSPSLPAILAIAEHLRLPGIKVIEAMVVAIETQARLRAAVKGTAIGHGFHKPGYIGAFGATAAVAKLLQLDPQQTAMALGLAGSRASGIALNTGTMSKPSHAGNSARTGVECGVLAKMGWSASPDVFGPKGFFDTFMPGRATPEALTEHSGETLRIIDPGVGFKPFPCNNYTHRAIDAALQLREEFSIEAAQIERVRVIFPDFDYVNRPQPRSGTEGRFSLQYTTLVALLDGEVTINSFTDQRLHSPEMVALLPKVHMQVDATIPFDKLKMYVVVEVQLKDGRQLAKRVDKLIGWPGMAGKPLTRDQRLAKFFSCTRRVLDDRASARIVDLVERLETRPDIAELMDSARSVMRANP